MPAATTLPKLPVYPTNSATPSGATAVRALDQLEAVIAVRKGAGDADKSYTAQLLQGGVARIGNKVVEEGPLEAAAEDGAEGRQHTIAEAADVVYHLLVLLAARDASLADVEEELARRFSMSGLEEKAARTRDVPPAHEHDP